MTETYITEQPTLDDLAIYAVAIASDRPIPSMTYIDLGNRGLKRRIACGAPDDVSQHDEIDCLADTLMCCEDPGQRAAGVRLSEWLAGFQR